MSIGPLVGTICHNALPFFLYFLSNNIQARMFYKTLPCQYRYVGTVCHRSLVFSTSCFSFSSVDMSHHFDIFLFLCTAWHFCNNTIVYTLSISKCVHGHFQSAKCVGISALDLDNCTPFAKLNCPTKNQKGSLVVQLSFCKSHKSVSKHLKGQL